MTNNKNKQMKKTYLTILTTAFLAISCSSDKGNGSDIDATANIVGAWEATELRVDENTASDNAIFAREALAYLTDQNCTIITLQFNADLTASATNSTDYLEIDTTSGFDIPCPTTFETETSTYTYENNMVSFVNVNGEVVEVNVTINGDTMLVDAEDLQIPEFDEEGQLVFQRR
ncbi:hypothetical protein F0361_03105 [Maribacter flavus]|uniref:Lipocalin-like domain-containing protein n=2 Tax=Maribacter flavus TaxID=1658664 RepID=A0A5B2TVT2_9FLAO|nr:hypothetical protein F0361_03105 [Maribacter flavus]